MTWIMQVAATFIASLLILFILWLIYKGFNKVISNVKFMFKKNKLKDDELEFLQDCLENNISDADIFCGVILNDPTSKKRAERLIYFYNKMKREVKKHE